MSVQRCANCNHAIYQHEPIDLELCRMDACPCPGFLTLAKGQPTMLDRAIAMLRFAHHSHAFGDEDCNPANCSAARFLSEHYDPIRHDRLAP